VGVQVRVGEEVCAERAAVGRAIEALWSLAATGLKPGGRLVYLHPVWRPNTRDAPQPTATPQIGTQGAQGPGPHKPGSMAITQGACYTVVVEPLPVCPVSVTHDGLVGGTRGIPCEAPDVSCGGGSTLIETGNPPHV
jgi:hypothetical protein